MPITTGKTRTYTASGSLSVSPGVLGLVVNNFPYGSDIALSFGTLLSGLGGPNPSIFGLSVKVRGEDPGLAFVTAISISGIGQFSSTSGAIHVLLTAGTGSYSFSCDVEEVSTYTQMSTRQYAWVIQDRPKVGGTCSGTVTFNGITQSFSGTITSLYANVTLAIGGHNSNISIGVDPGTQCLTSSVTTATATAMGQSMTLPFTHTYSLTGSGTAIVDCTSGNSVTVSGYPHYGGGCYFQAIRQVTKQGTINGGINAFDTTYPSAIVTEWAPPLAGSPTWTPFNFGDTITLDNYQGIINGWSTGGGISGSVAGPLPLLAMGDGLQCRMQPASLTSNNENHGSGWDLNLNARLKPFDALTIWQDASNVVDACTSTTGWSANVSLSGGFINVNSASLGGIATKSYFGYISEGYRYLEVDVKPNSSSGQPLILTVQNWKYTANMGAAGSLATVRFDLLAPYTNAVSGTAIGFVSRVLDGKQLLGGGSSTGPGWGVDTIGALSLQFPGSSGTYSVQAIRLKRDADTRLSFIESDSLAYDAATGSTLHYKFALADTDGKRSLDLGDAPQFGSPYTLSAGFGTLSQKANAINGWHVTPNVSAGDMAAWYYSWDVSNLCGAGAIYAGTPPATYWIDKAITSNPTQLQVQARAAYVLFTPACGDLTNAGGYGSPFAYYAWEFLRSRVTGVAIDKTQAPISGNTVTESEVVSGSSSGSGTTNSAGRFITGANYAKTALGQKAVLSGVSTATGYIAAPSINRDIVRVGYNSQAEGSGYAWHLQDQMGRLHEAVIVSGDVWYRRSDFLVPYPTWLFYNQATSYGDVTFAAMDYEPISGILYMLVERFTGGVYNLYQTSSTDNGASWSTPTLFMATARGGVPVTTQMGGFGFTWFVYDSGSSGQGKMHGQIRNSGDTSWPSPWTFKDSAGTDIAVADLGWGNVCKYPALQNGLCWTPTIQGDSSPTFWYSTDNGKTWIKFV